MRTVLVTGASTGIGRASALLLAARGFSVLAGVRREQDGAALARAGGGRVEPLLLDVTDAAAIRAASEQALRRGGLDALVNNAGIAVTGPLEYLPLDELRRQLEVNLIGQLALTQAVLDQLRSARGRIVNVSSIGGRVALPLYGPYAASKFALEGLSDALRRELRGAHVHVSVIEPGAIATPIWDRGVDAADRLWQAMPPEAHLRYGALVGALRRQATKLGEAGDPPGRVAEAVLHALTARRPRTRYVIGRDARVQARLARVLPDRALDALLRAGIRALARQR